MKKYFIVNYRPILYLLCLISLFVACKKSIATYPDVSDTNINTTFSVNAAKAYYEKNLSDPVVNSLLATTSNISSKRPRVAKVQWDYGNSAQNKNYDYVEVPITYSNQKALIVRNPSTPLDKNVLASNLNRLIIYRNKQGVINERILTYVPDGSYAVKHKLDISSNRIGKLDADFKGYIVYHDMKGNLLFFLRVENGVAIKKTNAKTFTNQITSLTLRSTTSIKTNDYGDCQEIEIWGRWCDTDAEGNPIESTCTDPQFEGYEYVGDCGQGQNPDPDPFPDPDPDPNPDPNPDPPSPCLDPANFDSAICSGGSGGSVTYPYSDGYTVFEADGNEYNAPSNEAVENDDYQTGNEDNNTYSNYQDANPWPTTGPVISTQMFQPYIYHVNCRVLAKMQIEKVGYTMSSYGASGQTIQIYTESGGANTTAARSAVGYLLTALGNNIPVVVGVDVAPGADPSNSDASTDHFIVIVGSGSDANGHYFRFYDSSTQSAAQGASSNNKLYYNSTTGLISGHTDSHYGHAASYEHDYIITQVRKSKVKQ